MAKPHKPLAARADEEWSKAELVDELRRLRERLGQEAELKQVIHDLHVHQEELRTQQEQLTESRAALEESRNRYADLFEVAPVGYVTLDPQGMIEEINQAALRLLECDRARVVPFRRFVSEADQTGFALHLERCRATERIVRAELVLERASGRLVPVELWSKRSLASGHCKIAILDLTERRRAEEERRRSLAEEEAARAASEAKDRFLAVLSHELRTPLTPILFALSALETLWTIPDSMRPHLDMIRRSVKMEARLIDDLLDVTRIARDKLLLEREVTDLHEILREAVRVCVEEARDAGVEITLEALASVHHVLGDPARLRQVFWNLLRNAAQHTPPHGRVTIRSRNEGRDVSVVVCDTGTGIAPELLSRIFVPFEQGKEEREQRGGLGLGLAISQGIVRAHAGTLTVSSPGPGKGATFEVTLATVPPARAPAPAPAPAGPARRDLRILLVEDDADTGVAFEACLRAYGYTVQRVTTVSAACGVHPSDFDLLISDLGLPDGTGFDVIRRLAAVHPVLGIALSGYGAGHDVQRSLEAGFRHHFVKPVDIETLLRAVEKLGNEAGARARP